MARQEASIGFKEKPPQAERFFRRGKAGTWREVLTSAQVNAVIASHAPMMMRMGYLKAQCDLSPAPRH